MRLRPTLSVCPAAQGLYRRPTAWQGNALRALPFLRVWYNSRMYAAQADSIGLPCCAGSVKLKKASPLRWM